MTDIRRAFRVAFIALSLAVSLAQATSFSTDQSDIWSATDEPGWAAEFVHRGTTIFATLYVYDASGDAVWFSATMESTGSAATPSWSGDLVETRGPFFGGFAFDPAQVMVRNVGTMTWIPQTATSGRLTYTVEGVTAAKNLQRYLIRYDDLSGLYVGGFHQFIAGCPTSNGADDFVSVTRYTQTGVAVKIENYASTDSDVGCIYEGVLDQAGQMGSIQGSFSCPAFDLGGNFTFSELQVTRFGLSGAYAMTYPSMPGCQASGWFGTARVGSFDSAQSDARVKTVRGGHMPAPPASYDSRVISLRADIPGAARVLEAAH